MKIINQNQVLGELADGLKTQSRCVIVKYTQPQVNYGFDDKPNFKYCDEANIPCVDIGRRGGTFVVNKDDLGFGFITKGVDNRIGELLYNEFFEFLKSRGLNVEQISNDILVDGYKVFGWASHYYQEFGAIYITSHITLSVDVELIKKVCIKPMVKVPKGLNDFGVQQKEVIEFLENFGEKYAI